MGDTIDRSQDAVYGRDGEYPLPCAVFRVDIDHDAGVATDALYTYANKAYCKAISRDVEGVVGCPHREIDEGDEGEWLEQCYRVVANGETVSGFKYDPLVRDWTSFCLLPSHDPDCCAYIFMRMTVDEQQRKQLMATADARTSLFISEMLSQLAAEQSYDTAMNDMLAMMSQVIHADRLSVFECNGSVTTTTFELLADGVESQLGIPFGAPKEMLNYWFRNVTHDRVVLVPNISIIQQFSILLYQWCVNSGVNSLLAAPFFSDGEIVGFLGAYNYQIDETIDLNRLFEAVSTFIAARIENRLLIDSLQRASTHDTLTGLLNRRGSQLAIDALLASDPSAHHALALIDLDDFKRVNDVYGHAAGDEALRTMAQVMKQTLPSDAILSRNGGDEFLVVVSNDAARRASILLAELTRHGVEFDFEGEHHHLTLSVGYARYPEQADSIEDLVSKADTALYAVKLAGKAGFGKYTSDAEEHMRFRLGFSARDILENMPYPLLVTKADERGQILFANTALAQLLDYDSSYDLIRATGGLYERIVHPDGRSRLMAAIEQLAFSADGAKMGDFAFRGLARDGGIKELSATFQFVDIENSGKTLYTYFKTA